MTDKIIVINANAIMSVEDRRLLVAGISENIGVPVIILDKGVDISVLDLSKSTSE